MHQTVNSDSVMRRKCCNACDFIQRVSTV